MSIAETYLSAGRFVGIGKQRYMSPVTGGVYGLGIRQNEIGLTERPAAVEVRAAPADRRCFPRGAPLSTHLAIVSISSCVRTRASAKSPQAGVGFHGGIWRVCVMYLMASACGAASAYVISENGAMSPG